MHTVLAGVEAGQGHPAAQVDPQLGGAGVRERGADESPLAALRRSRSGCWRSGIRWPPWGGLRALLPDGAGLAGAARAGPGGGRGDGEHAGRAAGRGGGRRGGPSGPDARLAAALIIAGIRAAGAEAVARQVGGDPVEEVAVEQVEVLRRTFDALERALPGVA
ncbi:hypothetical protein O1L68_31695 [Streptomyces lydicus]|nr:hypothetical protein [Streptomyces lydicus]